MAIEWFVLTGGKEHGPFSLQQLKSLAACGKLLPNARLRRRADPTIVWAHQVRDLFPAVTPPSPARSGGVSRPENSDAESIPPQPHTNASRIARAPTLGTWWSRYWQEHGIECLLVGSVALSCLLAGLAFNRPWQSEEDKVRDVVHKYIAQRSGNAPDHISLRSLGGGRYDGIATVDTEQLPFEAVATKLRGRKFLALLLIGAYDISCHLKEPVANASRRP
jgi:hypothetical protein